MFFHNSNYRTGRAVVTRNRQLVVQFTITLANYEYIFAYIFDQAGGIAIETRATGVVSTVPIDPGKRSPWGNIVSPGVLAQNHQHLFCVRIDPCIDGTQNTILYEESHALPWDEEINPYGNGYEIKQTVMEKSSWADSAPEHNRVFKIINPNIMNPISGRPIGYRFTPPSTQLMLAHPNSIMGRRAAYAAHHVSFQMSVICLFSKLSWSNHFTHFIRFGWLNTATVSIGLPEDGQIRAMWRLEASGIWLSEMKI